MTIHTHIDQLRIIRDQMENLNRRIINCADAFNGGQVEATGERSEPPRSYYINPQFSEELATIQNLLGTMSIQVSRLEDELIDTHLNKASS